MSVPTARTTNEVLQELVAPPRVVPTILPSELLALTKVMCLEGPVMPRDRNTSPLLSRSMELKFDPVTSPPIASAQSTTTLVPLASTPLSLAR